jgi:hypothetical protein
MQNRQLRGEDSGRFATPAAVGDRLECRGRRRESATTDCRDRVRRHDEGGDNALSAYRDKKRPLFLAKEFDAMLDNSPFLYEYFPELENYLQNYPDAELDGASDFLYWSMNAFGLKPLFRINHVVIYPLEEGHNADVAIASKMIYASHYFHTALELRVLVRDSDNPSDVGFYLISMNRSRSDGLTGLFGSIVRSQAVKRARDGLAGALANGKTNLEASYKRASTNTKRAYPPL